MKKKPVRLTELANTGGCSAKLGPGTLKNVLKNLPKEDNPRLLVGTKTNDDAGAYLLDDGTVLLQTTDFFPPMVDDPYTFGQIAAANALSDVYAMGGEPVTVLNIVCFPQHEDPEVLAEIIKGGADKIREAGAVIAGGHSIDDAVPKYGLAVSGLTTREKLRENSKARVGDKLILTKPIGSGILTLAMKGGICPEESEEAAVRSMTSLNRNAARTLEGYDVSAVTDVTGFSLLGHSAEMAEGSDVSVRIHADQVPFMPGVFPLAEMGIVPGGTYRNKKFFSGRYRFDLQGEWREKGESVEDVLFDPQTSGGLLIAVAPEQAGALLKELEENVETPVRLIGEIVERDGTDVIIQ